ncbi:hypothetical protein [Leucobacter sp. W1153]|uniref:hypothetical protein n=1 Tax=unclassified Leucobacter TaxID=2621730 RepID=UPI003F3F5A08
MKTLTRITTAIFAVIVSLFVAAPAFAAVGEGEKFDPREQFSAAGDPVNVVAILIVGAILLVVILGSAQVVGNLFEKKDG